MIPTLRDRIAYWSHESAHAHDAAPATVEYLRGRRVLITGGGGSIGAALVHAVRRCDPAALVIIEQDEGALFDLKRSFASLLQTEAVEFLLGSFGDEALLESVFQQHRPEIVFHAAAYKHVTLLEQNPFAAVENNILRTRILLTAALRHGADHFVLISTDKAVDPASVMGATKRVAELLLESLPTERTCVSAVRLGNVWGSQGSVVPVFMERLARGLPLVVTDPQASRYFLSMADAVSALLAALKPRSAGTVLLPELGAPVRIVDVAQALMEMHGSSVAIEFSRLGAGEKLTESLLAEDEVVLTSPPAEPAALRVVSGPAISPDEIQAALRGLEEAVASRDLPALVAALQRCMPRYTPSEVVLEAMRDRQGALA
jgi:FlaA1/EpsC-like NDP-sugar epimerase